MLTALLIREANAFSTRRAIGAFAIGLPPVIVAVIFLYAALFAPL